MNDANHPIWSIIRLTVFLTALCIILSMNASHFDDTEIRTLCWMFLGGACWEGGSHTFIKWLRKDE